MKRSELIQIIKEETSTVLKEEGYVGPSQGTAEDVLKTLKKAILSKMGEFKRIYPKTYKQEAPRVFRNLYKAYTDKRINATNVLDLEKQANKFVEDSLAVPEKQAKSQNKPKTPTPPPTATPGKPKLINKELQGLRTKTKIDPSAGTITVTAFDNKGQEATITNKLSSNMGLTRSTADAAARKAWASKYASSQR